jgi:hypothetical protein
MKPAVLLLLFLLLLLQLIDLISVLLSLGAAENKAYGISVSENICLGVLGDNICVGGKIETNEMGRACGAYGGG